MTQGIYTARNLPKGYRSADTYEQTEELTWAKGRDAERSWTIQGSEHHSKEFGCYFELKVVKIQQMLEKLSASPSSD